MSLTYSLLDDMIGNSISVDSDRDSQRRRWES